MPWVNGGRTHVPTTTRQRMLDRDGHQCTARMHDGTRCTETTRLEAHEPTQAHLVRTPTLDDVVTLCHWHHNLVTQQQARAARPRRTQQRPTETHPGLA